MTVALCAGAPLGRKARSVALLCSEVRTGYREDLRFFEHVPPSLAPDISPDFQLRGFRVPCVLVSPFARRGVVSHAEYDHTSILRLIEWRWGLNALSVRDAQAANIGVELDFDHPILAAPEIVVPEMLYSPPCPISSGYTRAVTAPAEAKIDDVADTALWIAAYRAKESARKDALFRDPLAARLAGEKGAVIAERMTGAAQFAWMTVVRTVVVDELVEEAIARGVRTVVNLGAGLDTRPYRMTLPEALRWIEVDSPRIVARKDELLAGERARCALSRIAADLADARARRELFARLGDVDDDVLVLTEGVLGYLANDEVAALADDLRARPAFKTWIVDYSARFLNRAVRARVGRRELKNAPLRFQPVDSERFFRAHGWRVVERRDLPIAGERLGRPLPIPWWFLPVHVVLPRRAKEAIRRMMGYARLEPA